MESRLPIVFWVISCFDKRLPDPLPLNNRTFLLDWSELTETERTDLLSILNEPTELSQHSPAGFDHVIVSVSPGPSQTDRRMLRFRRHFKLSTDDQFQSLCNEQPQNLRQAFITGEYVEDETGQIMDTISIFQHVTGQENPIIAGNAQSVLALGPIAPRAINDWTPTTANSMAHFIQIVEKIAASEWFLHPKSLTYEEPLGTQDGLSSPLQSRLLKAIFPNANETTAVLAYFRQLHAGDKLFERAANSFLKHCDSVSKRSWVEYEKRIFSAAIDQPPSPLGPGPAHIK